MDVVEVEDDSLNVLKLKKVPAPAVVIGSRDLLDQKMASIWEALAFLKTNGMFTIPPLVWGDGRKDGRKHSEEMPLITSLW